MGDRTREAVTGLGRILARPSHVDGVYGLPLGLKAFRLNSLQRTMVQWNSLHPYNAVHAARVSCRLDAERLEQIIQDRLAARMLRGLVLDSEAAVARWDGRPAAIEIQHLAETEAPMTAISQEMERQLNRSFPDEGRFVPFRFFVLPVGESFFLGLAYFHAVADAESVARLMGQLIAHYQGDAEPEEARAGELRAGGGAGWGTLRAPLLLLRQLAALPRRIHDMRRSCRPPCRDAQDFSNRLLAYPLGVEETQVLRKFGKAWGVTVNDVLLALLLHALARVAGESRHGSRRSRLAVGCIVNTRKDLGLDPEQRFGLFLGSFVVTHEVLEGVGLQALVTDIGEQTRWVKRQRLYLGGPMELALARYLVARASPEERRRFYPKHHPLWGGITNMSLDRLWDGTEGVVPADYLRAVSTGPAVPLVLSVTTLRKRTNLAFSYRPSVFATAEVEDLARAFLAPLRAERT